MTASGRGARVGVPSRTWALAAIAGALASLPSAGAALPPPVTQFELVGFLQSATFDGPDGLAGGTLMVNGHKVIVPRNTVVELPATALTWGELFTLAPAPYGPVQTGMAMQDVPPPLTTYEVTVVGNRVGDRYIAGLVNLSQQTLNSGQGYVTFIDYVRGELRVGGVRGDPTTGARVRINDPLGRFSRADSPDVRFTIDEDNPTVRSTTGFPMCLPRTNPSAADDPRCPQASRPRDPSGFASIFTMPPPNVGLTPDPTLPAPFEVGDYVTYAGTLLKDGPEPGAGPPSPTDSTYVSAWSVVANVGIFTAPGSDPAYVALDVTILGAGGVNVAGLVEATTRTRFEGFTTDPTRIIDLYGIDVDPCTGQTTDRHWGAVDVDPGPPTGAVRGRWRFRPPTGVLSLPASGTFLPVTREVRARIRSASLTTVPSGLVAGQYHAPIAEYLFPENAAIGAPIVPNDFSAFAFLAQGIGPWPGGGPRPVAGGVVGQLSPWPGATPPTAAACTTGPLVPPIADAGQAQAVPSGATVTLDGSASRSPNGQSLAYAWSQTAGPAVVLSASWVARPTFVAPPLAATDAPVTLTFSLIVSDGAGPSAPATVAVTVSPAAAPLPPVASAGLPQTVPSGAAVFLDGSASFDPNAPPQALAYQWTQTGPAELPVTLVGAGTATPTFQAPFAAPGTTVVATFELTVTNAAGLSSTAQVAVTVAEVGKPIAVVVPDQVVREGTLVQLDGTGSFDPAGLQLGYAWTQVAGPPVTLTDANGPVASFIAPPAPVDPALRTLTFTLTVTNAFAASLPTAATVRLADGPDTVTVLTAVYRAGQARLTVTASSTVAGAQLFLRSPGGGADVPFSTVAGVATADVRGVPDPGVVTVVSSLGGTASSAITRLR